MFSNVNCIYFIIVSTLIVIGNARGPHHPNSQISRQKREHAQEHLSFNEEHIAEDIQERNLPPQNPEDMTEDEKNYLYFKVHDLDGNDKLDGLEIFYSATHHSDGDEHGHDMNDSHDTDEPAKLKLLENNDYNGDEMIEKSFNHIIDVLDNFLDVADLNQDGFLNFAEYAAAVKLGNAMANAEAEYDNM